MSHPDFPPFMRDKQPIESVLKSLEFIPTNWGYERKWNDLGFAAGKTFNCWFLMRDGLCANTGATADPGKKHPGLLPCTWPIDWGKRSVGKSNVPPFDQALHWRCCR